MDVRSWGVDQILMLPDYCLSRRYGVFCELVTVAEDTVWDISEVALPDRAIVHEFVMSGTGLLNKEADIRVALSDQIPTSTVMMDRLEPLFMGMGRQGADPRRIHVSQGMNFHLDRLKMYLPAQGRRLVLEATAGAGVTLGVQIGVVVSAVPTEVPDCLLSV